ncbi:hypothetical protein [Ruminococcus sp.]|uniref:hypothetical protein n=1 Tax=Ruminococcus sp. TaxID=41978 RepID=UPI0025DF8FCF|nr:hypothetical protein [Ruminococcus sp.]
MKKISTLLAAFLCTLAFILCPFAAVNDEYTNKILTAIAAEEASPLYGDVNCDGIVNIDDLEYISNYFKDPDAYPLSPMGKVNAHMNIGAGLSASDIYPLICYLGGTVKELPTNEYKVQRFEKVTGDADRDGDVDFDDFNQMMEYVSAPMEGSTLTYQQYSDNVSPVGVVGNGRGTYPLPYMLEYLSGFSGKDYDFKSFLLNPQSDHMKFEITTEPNYGDYNCDGVVDILDGVEMQNLINQVEDYKIRCADNPNAVRITNVVTAQGLRNADVYNPGTGITEEDVQAVLDYINADTLLPVIKDGYVRYTPTAGDFNCDNHFNLGDAIQLWEYINKDVANAGSGQGGTYEPNEQGIKNADYNHNSKPDYEDLDAMLRAIKEGKSFSPITTTTTATTTITTTTPQVTTHEPTEKERGDSNCDGDVDMADSVLIMQALANPNKYGIGGTDEHSLTEQGQINADVDKGSKGLTSNDALKIQQLLLGIITEL